MFAIPGAGSTVRDKIPISEASPQSIRLLVSGTPKYSQPIRILFAPTAFSPHNGLRQPP
jgi:hypothetical protein